MTLFKVISLLILASPQVFAAPGCLDKFEVFDNTSVQMLPNKKTGCFLTVSPRTTQGLVYRSFLFDNTGLFMIFDSLGNGPESEATASRELYFFPRKTNEVSYRYDSPTQSLRVKTPSGKVFVFNTKKAILVSATNSTLAIDYEVNGKNNGGLEIIKNDAFYLDLGYKIGQSPSQDPKDSISFKDTKNNSCIVKNSDVFNYTSDQDVIFKYEDAQLIRFLKTSCPHLKLNNSLINSKQGELEIAQLFHG
jgi:hypothetical protein